MDDKAPDAFRTISEVADELDLPQHVLRFWESRFREIRPMKRGGGRRYYRPDDIELLRGIRHLLYGEGYTIRGVQRILREQGIKFVQAVWQDGATQPPHGAVEDDERDAVDEDAEEAADTLEAEGGIRARLGALIGHDFALREPALEARQEPPLESAPFPSIDIGDRLGGPVPSRAEPALDRPAEPLLGPVIEPVLEPALEQPSFERPARPVDRAMETPAAATTRGIADRGLLQAALTELIECRRTLEAALTHPEPTSGTES